MAQLLLDYAREEVGLKMGGFHAGNHVGWTTDGRKADAMSKQGARVTTYAPQESDKRFHGFEISFPEGTHKRK